MATYTPVYLSVSLLLSLFSRNSPPAGLVPEKVFNPFRGQFRFLHHTALEFLLGISVMVIDQWIQNMMQMK